MNTEKTEAKINVRTNFSKLVQSETIYEEICLETLLVHPGRQAVIFVLCNTRGGTLQVTADKELIVIQDKFRKQSRTYSHWD